jgi:hypothetical protein
MSIVLAMIKFFKVGFIRGLNLVLVCWLLAKTKNQNWIPNFSFLKAEIEYPVNWLFIIIREFKSLSFSKY